MKTTFLKTMMGVLSLSVILLLAACGGGATSDGGTDKDAGAGKAKTETHKGHDHSGHDHSGHDHSGHDHSGHSHGAANKTGKEYTSAYICPMHCKGSGSAAAGKCPACKMDYVANKKGK